MGIQEVDPHKYIQLILTAKVINGEMTVCLTNGAGIIGCPYGKKKKKEPRHIPHTWYKTK